MKTWTSRTCVVAGLASCLALTASSQTTPPAATESASAPVTQPAPAKLPYGVDDVLKLSHAQVSEEVTLNYIKNSGTIYNLAPGDIVYLRNEGVSDRVVNAMIDQRKNVPAEQAAQAVAANQAQATAPATPDPNGVAAAPAVPQYAPAYVQPAPVYIEPQPTYVPASTVYVIPYRGSSYSYANYGGVYCGPSTVYSVGFSSGPRCGPYYGGRYRGSYGGGHYRYYGRH